MADGTNLDTYKAQQDVLLGKHHGRIDVFIPESLSNIMK